MKMTPEMHREVIDFINSTTTEQQMYLIQCIADKITINMHSMKQVKTYDIPFGSINLNGMFIDINILK